MTDMPEEIWAYVCTAPDCPTQHIVFDYKEGATKYTRADKSPSPDAERLADFGLWIDSYMKKMRLTNKENAIQHIRAMREALADFEKGGS